MELHLHFNIELHLHFDGRSDTTDLTKTDDDTTPDMLLEHLQRQMQATAGSRSPSTQSNYLTAVRSLQRYLQHDVPLRQTDATLISGYEHWLRQQGLCLNSISCYMRSLRALLGNEAGTAFSHVFTGHQHTDKRSVSVDAISRLQSLTLKEGSFAALARDVFLFSFYAMGMPFVDVAHLKHTQVSSTTIKYARQKTGRNVTVTLLPQLTDIMQRYEGTSATYVFPILQQGTAHEYQVALGRYNRALHRLQRLAGLDVPLTSYVARHSWATTAYGSNVDLAVISQALGHASARTTMIYIREIDDQRLATANEEVVGQVN